MTHADGVNFQGRLLVDTWHSLRGNPAATQGAGYGAARRHDRAGKLAHADESGPLSWLACEPRPRLEHGVAPGAVPRRPGPTSAAAGVGEAGPVTVVITVAAVAVEVSAATIVIIGRRRRRMPVLELDET